MTFSTTSVMIVFLILGQLSQQNGTEPLPRMTSETQIFDAFKNSCTEMLEVGPMADVDLTAFIQFQRESIVLLEENRTAFVQEHCEKQKKSHLQDSLKFLLFDSPVRTPYLLPSRVAGWPKSSAGKNSSVLLVSSNPIENFTCDKQLAEKEFAEEYGGEEELKKQLNVFADFNLPDLVNFYDFFCAKDETKQVPRFLNYQEIAKEYNALLDETDSFDLSIFQNFRTTRGANFVDDKEQPLGPFIQDGRTVDFVPSSEIPDLVKKAFIAIEDHDFYTHRGVEPKGVLRGFFKYMQSGTIEGGSTITQQLVKNALTGNDVSLNRKAKEMLLARRLENEINDKDKILEAYLNIIDLGRGSKGIATATKRYFGEGVKVSQLGLNEATYFAGITHKPAYYNPTYASDSKIRSRQKMVLANMVELGSIGEAEATETPTKPLPFVPLEFPKVSYFQSAASDEYLLTTPSELAAPERILTTQNVGLQTSVDSLVQKHLANFEMTKGKVYWKGPLRNIAYLWTVSEEDLKKGKKQKEVDLVATPEIWSAELLKSESLFQGVQWETVVLLKKGEAYTVGVLNTNNEPETKTLRFGDVGSWHQKIIEKLEIGDVLFAEKKGEDYFFRVPPTVQSAVVVMDVNNGEVKAASGGFDYRLTPFNRAVKAYRQPGSTSKPFTYLAALDLGFSPTDTISGSFVEFPKISGCDYWAPDNFSRDASGSGSLAGGLIHSNNRLTANLFKKLADDPRDALMIDYNIMVDFGFYDYNPDKIICFPTILGSNEVSMLAVARAYAAFANGGKVVNPTFLKDGQGQTSPRYERRVYSVNPASIGTLSQILSRVVTEGTGKAALSRHGGIVAGKTGTSSSSRDVWFVGYTNYHVVVVWMGYDRDDIELPDKQIIRPTLGVGNEATGGQLVGPLAASIFDRLFNPEEGEILPLDSALPLNFSYGLVAENETPTVAPEAISTEPVSPPKTETAWYDDSGESKNEKVFAADFVGNGMIPEGNFFDEFSPEQTNTDVQSVNVEDSWRKMQSGLNDLLNLK